MKLCMDCKHIIEGIDGGYMCKLYPVQYMMPVDDRKSYPKFCIDERKNGKCGPEGKLWEPHWLARVGGGLW